MGIFSLARLGARKPETAVPLTAHWLISGQSGGKPAAQRLSKTVKGEKWPCLARSKVTLETILVVDNDEAVLKTVVTLLEGANFRVLSADGGDNARKLAEETEGPIHLLLSEVDLPGMSGPDLGKALKNNRADIHVMLMSGQVNGNLLVLNYGWAYIRKQLVPEKLVQMVTDVLHAPDRSQLGDEFDSAKDTGHKALEHV